MKFNILRQAAIIASLAFASTAAADTITIDARGLLSNHLTSGIHAGEFSGAGALPALYTINNASFSFRFSDDQDDWARTTPVHTGTTTTGYESSSESPYYNYLVRTVRDFYEAEQSSAGESVSVKLGSAQLDGGSAETSVMTNTVFSQDYSSVFDYEESFGGGWRSCGPGCSYYVPPTTNVYSTDYFKFTTITVNDQTGQIEVSGDISDAGLLDELITNRALGFSLNIGGDLLLESAQLHLDVTEQLAPAPIPEPGNLLLMFGALGALAAAGRRRRQ